MKFQSIREIVNAFCIDKPLTKEILNHLKIVGRLQGRNIRQIFPDSPRLGHLIHRIRYCFNLSHYREDFNQAAADFIKKSSIVAHAKPAPPLPIPLPLALPEPVPPAVQPVADPAPEPIVIPQEPIVQPPPAVPQAPQPVAAPAPEPIVLPKEPIAQPAAASAPMKKQAIFTQHTENFLCLVHEKLGEQSAELWRILFTHFFDRHGQDHFYNFTSHRRSHLLHFKEPLVIHMNPLDQDHKPVPEGGLILTFGRKGRVEIEMQNGVIHFKSGVTGFAKIPSGFPLAGRLIEMKIYQFASDSEGVTIKARTLGLSGGKKESYASIRETWSQRAIVLPHDADFKDHIEKQSKLSF